MAIATLQRPVAIGAGATSDAPPPRRARAAAAAVAGVLALVVIAALHLQQGRAPVGLADLVDVLRGSAAEQVDAVVVGSRLPRLAAGLVVGAALAASGVLLQAATRNPLAEPVTTGVASGAFLAVVVAGLLGVTAGPLPNGAIAFLGGTAAALVVLLAASGPSSGPARLILAGMAVSLTLSSVTATLLLLFEQELGGLFFWGHGSLVQSGFERIVPMAPVVAVGVVAAVLLGRRLDVLELGDDTAATLGVRPVATRIGVTAVAIALTAAAVTIAGPIGFVGLLAPHLVRAFGVHGHRSVLLAAGLWGGVLVLAADVLTQLLRPSALATELPTGVVTALVGAPLLVLVARRLPDTGRTPPSLHGRVDVRRRTLAVGTTALLAALVLAGLAVGDLAVPLGDVAAALAGDGSTLAGTVVLDVRLPRLLVAALAGAALAVGGAVLQAVTRNPLADPTLLGVSGGASVGALGLVLLVPSAPVALVPLAAFAGAATVLLVVVLAVWRRGIGPERLALVGIGTAAFTAAVVDLLVARSGLRVTQALTWLSGSTYARDLGDVHLLAPWVALLVPLVWVWGRHLDVLTLDDERARGLGLRVDRARLAALAAACLLSGAAVATVGAVGFVGLLAPHLARPLSGPLHRRLVPVAAAIGAALVMAADVVGRTVLAPKEVPAGLVVALLGAPFFVSLLWRTRGAAP